MGSILLLGLQPELASPLTAILEQLGHHVIATRSLARVLINKAAAAAFVAGDDPDYRECIRSVLAARPDLPVILVNRLPDNQRWLDALELGVADYCGAPFESIQIQWILDGALRRPRTAAAA